MKPAKQFEAVVERQDPARNEIAQLTVLDTFCRYTRYTAEFCTSRGRIVIGEHYA